jgi:oxygen-independent coproporphyrinogen III oxidase
MKEFRKDLGLYIHIPFCVKKCDYCDFLSAPADEETKHSYIKALIAEIKSYKDISREYLVKTIYIGGGTPSTVKGEYIEEVMDAIKEVFTIPGIENTGFGKESPEITIEVNPGTVTEEKLKSYLKAGINRLSFGLQSTDNKELKLLGRIHTYETFLENYKLARNMGFKNINIDLMSGLPGQTLSNWLNTLKTVINLNPEHISAYSLILEEGTPFFSRYREEDLDEELDRTIYAETQKCLNKAGYYKYEISNYAKPGFESRHNTSYWIRTDYLGIGLGAASLLNNTRFQNVDDLTEYLRVSTNYHNIHKIREVLSVPRQMEEFMFLGLRMCKGISKKRFKDQFGVSLESVYQDVINKYLAKGLIGQKGDRIYLTDKGIDVSNMVLADFLLDTM